jgi:hypothetical protein
LRCRPGAPGRWAPGVHFAPPAGAAASLTQSRSAPLIASVRIASPASARRRSVASLRIG